MATTLKKLVKQVEAALQSTERDNDDPSYRRGYREALEWVKEQSQIVEKPGKPQDPKKAFITWYCEQYKLAGLGTLLISNWGREMKTAQRILQLPLEKKELARRVQVFLNDKESDWIRGKARTMGLFLTVVNNYDLRIYSQRHEKVALGGKVVYGENEPTILR